MQRAANSRFPPFLLDMPRHAAPCTKVLKGLTAAVRRVCYEEQARAEINGHVIQPK